MQELPFVFGSTCITYSWPCLMDFFGLIPFEKMGLNCVLNDVKVPPPLQHLVGCSSLLLIAGVRKGEAIDQNRSGLGAGGVLRCQVSLYFQAAEVVGLDMIIEEVSVNVISSAYSSHRVLRMDRINV